MVFMKIDLRQRYDNVRIKEEDKWKAAFSISEGIFELMVMFFGLTNLLATFQTMMNDLLRDMIKAEDIITKNNLFVKLEKCVQKIREVRFLEVIIGPDGIKMEKEKVQGVVDWLVSRSMKNMQKFLGLANYYRQFVKDFARVAKSLYEMIKKNVK